MRRNINTTFSSEGIEIDPKKKEGIERQYSDNRQAMEQKLEQERQKLIDLNLRRVNRSIGRLEKQNKNFLNQMAAFRKDRVSIGKVSSSNMRALSNLQSKAMLSSNVTSNNEKVPPASTGIEHGAGTLSRALGGVSSVLRIGMDSKSQLDGPLHSMVTPAHDRTLNNTKTNNLASGVNTASTTVRDFNHDINDSHRNGQIFIQEQTNPNNFQPKNHLVEISSNSVLQFLPNIVQNASIQNQHAQMYRNNYSAMRSSDIRKARNIGLSDSPSSKVIVTSRNGQLEINQDYIDRRQSEIEYQIYARQQALPTRSILEKHKYGAGGTFGQKLN